MLSAKPTTFQQKLNELRCTLTDDLESNSVVKNEICRQMGGPGENYIEWCYADTEKWILHILQVQTSLKS